MNTVFWINKLQFCVQYLMKLASNEISYIHQNGHNDINYRLTLIYVVDELQPDKVCLR